MWRGLALISSWALVFVGSACSKKTEDAIVEPVLTPGRAAPMKRATYVGTVVCSSCHETQHREWIGSHHELAMQAPTPDNVLGDFADVTARYYGETVRFIRDGDGFAVEALGADGARARFPVVYAFGVEPLQQYLVEVEPGRLQAFPFAWDTRAKAEGGQRWFHLQPDEYIEPGDPLHWTGPSYNWNHACADCHSTAVKKNYDRGAKRYSTEYFEVNVGCEACHGPGSHHVELIEAKERSLPVDAGFSRHLPSPPERAWAFVQGRDIAVLEPTQQSDEVEACAPCHSRRADLGDDYQRYHDRYRLALLEETLYFDDGQIKDEVFVLGSFLQSKMYAAGVVCSDCHDSHSAGLVAEGNLLCARCHKANVFDGPQHHFHETGTAGSLCTDCHMPKRTYMVVDDRADHRFGLPRPALSKQIGAPDVCTGCHRGRSPEWAERQIRTHFPKPSEDAFASVFHAARSQQPRAESGLIELVAGGTAPDIVRATALLELGHLGSPALPVLAMRTRNDPSPIVRRTAAGVARELPPEQRAEIVRAMLRDPVRTVRIEAVAALLGVDARGWTASDLDSLEDATAEYVEARSFTADQGEGLVDLGYVAMLVHDLPHAEANLREALEVDPTFTAAYVNLADLYRSQGRDREAEAILRNGLERAADPAPIEFALGLALIRLTRYTEATVHLRRAHELRPRVIRFGYVLAVAQFDRGQRQAALRTLERIHDRYPANRDVLQLLATYNGRVGRLKAAERYAAELRELEGALEMGD
ncbi:MAG: HEAT repeat domain-containing protein [Polyangiales bacterium]|jgi:predicted CXXCH cytochrome family protein